MHSSGEKDNIVKQKKQTFSSEVRYFSCAQPPILSTNADTVHELSLDETADSDASGEEHVRIVSVNDSTTFLEEVKDSLPQRRCEVGTTRSDYLLLQEQTQMSDNKLPCPRQTKHHLDKRRQPPFELDCDDGNEANTNKVAAHGSSKQSTTYLYTLANDTTKNSNSATPPRISRQPSNELQGNRTVRKEGSPNSEQDKAFYRRVILDKAIRMTSLINAFVKAKSFQQCSAQSELALKKKLYFLLSDAKQAVLEDIVVKEKGTKLVKRKADASDYKILPGTSGGSGGDSGNSYQLHRSNDYAFRDGNAVGVITATVNQSVTDQLLDPALSNLKSSATNDTQARSSARKHVTMMLSQPVSSPQSDCAVYSPATTANKDEGSMNRISPKTGSNQITKQRIILTSKEAAKPRIKDPNKGSAGNQRKVSQSSIQKLLREFHSTPTNTKVPKEKKGKKSLEIHQSLLKNSCNSIGELSCAITKPTTMSPIPTHTSKTVSLVSRMPSKQILLKLRPKTIVSNRQSHITQGIQTSLMSQSKKGKKCDSDTDESSDWTAYSTTLLFKPAAHRAAFTPNGLGIFSTKDQLIKDIRMRQMEVKLPVSKIHELERMFLKPNMLNTTLNDFFLVNNFTNRKPKKRVNTISQASGDGMDIVRFDKDRMPAGDQYACYPHIDEQEEEDINIDRFSYVSASSSRSSSRSDCTAIFHDAEEDV